MGNKPSKKTNVITYKNKDNLSSYYVPPEVLIPNSYAEKVIYTGNIPQCPYCKKPTKRSDRNSENISTMAYFKPTYNKNGVNTNPDRNTQTSSYQCLECNKGYKIQGNNHDGFKYHDIKIIG